jgi:hypothetical protein
LKEDAYLELWEILPLIAIASKRMSGIGGMVESALFGEDICQERIEARLYLGYLQMCPLKPFMQAVDFPEGRVLIVDMFYDAEAVYKMFQ